MESLGIYISLHTDLSGKVPLGILILWLKSWHIRSVMLPHEFCGIPAVNLSNSDWGSDLAWGWYAVGCEVCGAARV